MVTGESRKIISTPKYRSVKTAIKIPKPNRIREVSRRSSIHNLFKQPGKNYPTVDTQKQAVLLLTSITLIAAGSLLAIHTLPQNTGETGKEPANITITEALNNASQLQNQTVTLEGKAVAGLTMCTQIACSDQNPCCNTCQASLKLTNGKNSIQLRFPENGGCSGTNCQLNCTPLNQGENYTVTGQIKTRYGQTILETKHYQKQ